MDIQLHILAVLGLGASTLWSAVPVGIASAILAGLNPIHGLYALMIGTPIAAMLVSSHFMVVATRARWAAWCVSWRMPC